MATIAHERLGNLLGCHDGRISEHIAVDCMGKIEVEDRLGEIGAVTIQQIESCLVAPIVESLDKSIVLLCCRGYSKTINFRSYAEPTS